MQTSLPDPIAELRRTRPAAPDALRLRVEAIAARSPQPQRRRLGLRRALLVLVPAVLLVVVGGIVFAGRGERTAQTGVRGFPAGAGATRDAAAPKAFGTATVPGVAPGAALESIAPAPARGRLQDYDATLSLKLKDADALSQATKRALAIARSLGGHASSVQVHTERREGDATLRLRVPVSKVQDAVTRLSALGTITGESVTIRDLQAQVNATERALARLQRQLTDLRSKPTTPELERRIASLTAQIRRLQRGLSGTVREARLATVDLSMTTREAAKPPKRDRHGPLDGAWTALRWMGIGVLYGLIVGGPVAVLGLLAWLAWRVARRHREQRLLGVS